MKSVPAAPALVRPEPQYPTAGHPLDRTLTEAKQAEERSGPSEQREHSRDKLPSLFDLSDDQIAQCQALLKESATPADPDQLKLWQLLHFRVPAALPAEHADVPSTTRHESRAGSSRSHSRSVSFSLDSSLTSPLLPLAIHASGEQRDVASVASGDASPFYSDSESSTGEESGDERLSPTPKEKRRIVAAATELVRSNALGARTLLTDCTDLGKPESFNVVPVRHCIFAKSPYARRGRSKHSQLMRELYVQPDVMFRAVKTIHPGDPLIFLRDHTANAVKDSTAPSRPADGGAVAAGSRMELQCGCDFDVCQYHVACYCGESQSGGNPLCPWPASMHTSEESEPLVPPFLAVPGDDAAETLLPDQVIAQLTPAAAGDTMAMSDVDMII